MWQDICSQASKYEEEEGSYKPCIPRRKARFSRSMAESRKGCEHESNGGFSVRQLMEGFVSSFPGLCWSQYFSQSSTIYFHWASTPHLKSSVCSPPALQGCIRMKMCCPTAKHGPSACVALWSRRWLGQWRCSICPSPSESNLTSPFLAREGTEKHSPTAALVSAYSKLSMHHVSFSRNSGSLGL